MSLVGSVHDLPDDPQLAANGIITKPVDDIGADYVINHPVNVDAIHRVGVRKAPEVGEHTEAVLKELGYDAAAIDAFGKAAWSEVSGESNQPRRAALPHCPS